MRTIVAAIAVSTLAVALVACGDDGAPAAPTASSPTAIAAGTTAASTPERTPTTTAPATGETVEVTGIVGGLNLRGNSIEIKRLQGAAVTRISVTTRTVFRKAAGGTLTFNDIRTSDRIIARGTLNERGDVLVASQVTVQDVIPGAQPGG